MTHWHVESSLAGYGPDAAGTDGFESIEDIRSVAHAVRDELLYWVESERQSADVYGERRDYQAAWLTMKHSEELDYRAVNLDGEREQAPVYRDNPEAWEETLQTLLQDYPVNVDPMRWDDGGWSEFRSRVYVWQCNDTGCGMGEEEDISPNAGSAS